MRKEIYKMLCERLGNIPEIKYIDLWNHNVEFINKKTTGNVQRCLWSFAQSTGRLRWQVCAM